MSQPHGLRPIAAAGSASATGASDPTSLPLFSPTVAGPARPGRVRSQFRLTPTELGPSAQPPTDLTVHQTYTQPTAPQSGGGASTRLDWALVAAFRSQASEQLSAALGGDRGRLDRQAQRELGRSIILELLESEAAEQVSAGRDAWTPHDQQALASAVFDALFGLGRLQPLVDDDRVENIIITGHNTVRLELTDGTLLPGPPVADSDEELIDFLVFLASRSEVNARPFSEAQPRLHLRLDGGARLAAAAWVTPRPSVVIRRHRLRRVTLADLVDRCLLYTSDAADE